MPVKRMPKSKKKAGGKKVKFVKKPKKPKRYKAKAYA